MRKLRLRKNTISQITQFSFWVSVAIATQFDFQEGRNRESCENYYIEDFFFGKMRQSQNKNSQFSQETQIAIRNFRHFANNTIGFCVHFTTLRSFIWSKWVKILKSTDFYWLKAIELPRVDYYFKIGHFFDRKIHFSEKFSKFWNREVKNFQTYRYNSSIHYHQWF